MQIGKVIVAIGSEHEVIFDSFGKCIQGDESKISDPSLVVVTVVTTSGGIVQDEARLKNLLGDFPSDTIKKLYGAEPAKETSSVPLPLEAPPESGPVVTSAEPKPEESSASVDEAATDDSVDEKPKHRITRKKK